MTDAFFVTMKPGPRSYEDILQIFGADRGSDHGVKSIIIPVVIFPFFPESSGIISYFFAREFWNYFHLWIDLNQPFADLYYLISLLG